jgi:hypothetical protein
MTERDKKDAAEIGKILPCRWTPEQRLRAIELTGDPEFIDECIKFSRMMNGMLPKDTK